MQSSPTCLILSFHLNAWSAFDALSLFAWANRLLFERLRRKINTTLIGKEIGQASLISRCRSKSNEMRISMSVDERTTDKDTLVLTSCYQHLLERVGNQRRLTIQPKNSNNTYRLLLMKTAERSFLTSSRSSPTFPSAIDRQDPMTWLRFTRTARLRISIHSLSNEFDA